MFELFKKPKADNASFKELPPQEMDGWVFTIKDIQENKSYRCSADCTTLHFIKEGIHDKCIECIDPKVRGTFSGIEITVHIVATSSVDGVWTCMDEDVRIVSTKGYTYKGKILCGNVVDNRHRAKDHEEIQKRTMADMVYVFPFLPEGEQIQAILVGVGRSTLRFDIIEGEEELYDINTYRHLWQKDNKPLGIIDNHEDTEIRSDSYYQRMVFRTLINLKTAFYKRLNAHLNHSQARELEERIDTQIFSLNLQLEGLVQQGFEGIVPYYEDFQREVTNYREVLFQKKFAEEKHEVRVQRVSELLNINPYDFEFLCSTIMEKMGYENLVVTPRANDKGIDILGEMNGIKTAAQCKRYRSSVGSPDMQMFIGAMHNAKATKGIYFTTGSFTKEAIIMASSNNIMLFGKEQFIDNLSLIDDFKAEPLTQTRLWDDDDLPEYARKNR